MRRKSAMRELQAPSEDYWAKAASSPCSQGGEADIRLERRPLEFHRSWTGWKNPEAADYLRHYLASSLLVGYSIGAAAVLAVAKDVPEVRAIPTIAAPADAVHVLRNFGTSLKGYQSMLIRGPVAPFSNRFKWKLASWSSARLPTSAANEVTALGSPASSLAKAAR